MDLLTVPPHYLRYRALSSVYGKIDQILLTFPGDVKGVKAERVLDRYKAIFEAFGDRVTFVILANLAGEEEDPEMIRAVEEAKGAFEDALLKAHLCPHHHVIHINSPLTHPAIPQMEKKGASEKENAYTHGEWVQDPFVIMKAADGTTVFMEPFFYKSRDYTMIAEQVAAEADVLIKPTYFRVEGGNMLFGDDYALIGNNIFERNRQIFFPDKKKVPVAEAREKLTAAFKQLLGVKYIIWIGQQEQHKFRLPFKTGVENRQPLFHIDLFITLAGRHKDGKELVFVGALDNYEDNVIGFEDHHRPALEEFSEALNEVEQMLKGFDKPGPRFEVRRLKMGLKIDRNWKGEQVVIPYSYNNGQVEWYEGIRRIYLPEYPDFKHLEEENTILLSQLDARPTFIRHAFEYYAESGGSLHCLSKVLHRSRY